MNRLLELRLEQEGEGELDTRDKREELNRLLEMRLEQEGVSRGCREGSFESDQSTNGNLSYDDESYQAQRTFNPNDRVGQRNWQNLQHGHGPLDQPNGFHNSRRGLNSGNDQRFSGNESNIMGPNSAHTNFANVDQRGDYFGDGNIRGNKGFAGGNMAGSRFVENGIFGQGRDF